MRILIFITLFFISTMTLATTTIETVIKKNRHYAASWWEKALRLNKDFPQKRYVTDGIILGNPNKFVITPDNSIVKNAGLLVLTVQLDLVSYNPMFSSYKFDLSIPEVGLFANGKTKKIPAEVYIGKDYKKSISISGSFKRVPPSPTAMPKINESDSSDFMLSVDEILDITISTQHDIPIKIVLHD